MKNTILRSAVVGLVAATSMTTIGAVAQAAPADDVDPGYSVAEPTAAADNDDSAATDDADAEAPAADQEEYDLKPYVQVSGAKAPGFAGLVSVRVENVGSERYFQEFPMTTFRIDVKTDEGPEGVDRLITPGSFSGAHIRDLGFNKDESTRSFEVTLSNPVNPGDKQLLANLNFGDGNTKEGRLKNYITVTQTGRHAKDTSDANDQNVDSRENTITDTGNESPGIF